MADVQTLARPYAVAAFKHAQASGKVAEWGQALEKLAEVVSSDVMQVVIRSPQVSGEQAAAALAATVEGQSADVGTFIKLLAEYDRLALLPAISQSFAEQSAAADNRLEAVVRTAFALSDDQAKALQDGLAKRLERTVELEFEEDTSLIGGVFIESGDIVIDASIRGDLDRLAQQLH